MTNNGPGHREDHAEGGLAGQHWPTGPKAWQGVAKADGLESDPGALVEAEMTEPLLAAGLYPGAALGDQPHLVFEQDRAVGASPPDPPPETARGPLEHLRLHVRRRA